MTVTPTAWVVGLTRAAGTVAAVRVRCPICSRTHHHPWPVRGTIPSPCSPFAVYRVAVWTGTPTTEGAVK